MPLQKQGRSPRHSIVPIPKHVYRRYELTARTRRVSAFSSFRFRDYIAASREELEASLRKLEVSPVLPEWLEMHPNEIIWMLYTAWNIDGRRGDMKQEEIAHLVAEKSGEHFDRNQMQAVMNAKPMRTRTGVVHQVLIPSFSAMKALIEVAFEHWTEDGPRSYDPPLNLEKVAENACQAIADFDWYGRKTNLLPLLKILVETGSSVFLEDIETLVTERLHFLDPIPQGKVQEVIQGLR